MEPEIKKIEISNRLFVILVILILGILGSIFAEIVFKFFPPDYHREITVSAEGKAFAKPDVALVNLGVKTEGLEINKIVKENTEKMNSILVELKNLGIEEKDIQTTKYNLSPHYEWMKEGEKIFKGYVLEQEIRVKIRNFEKISEVLEKATQKEANLIGNLSFSIDDPERLYTRAREEAIKRAKEKAESIAKQTGIKLKKLVNVYEGYGYYPPLPVRMEGAEKAPIPSFETAPEIQPGELEVKVLISLVYRIK